MIVADALAYINPSIPILAGPRWLTPDEILAIEPRIRAVLSEARAHRRLTGLELERCYVGLKRNLDSLCGRNSRHEAFADSRNFETMHGIMCDALNYR